MLTLPSKDDLRILVVDDNSMDRMALVAFLKKLGFSKIQEAEDGQIAEFKVKNSVIVGAPFHLLFVDWNMPSVNGISFVKYVRKQLKLKDALLFMITVTPFEERVQEAIKQGVDDFIVKPAQPSAVEKKIKEHIKFEP